MLNDRKDSRRAKRQSVKALADAAMIEHADLQHDIESAAFDDDEDDEDFERYMEADHDNRADDFDDGYGNGFYDYYDPFPDNDY